ncbi:MULTISPECIES: hypothetical protein [Streptomyces]|uniref:Uncharacterized protein n=1 Tax=Streptomyces cacaoi TaxID=1898 RepID=A0A4Y3QTN5_STRCI|nr:MULTISPECIES: hypothetical protein [Streptomyces]NNG84358.1 hypothetical protein [Streptomyces cacaoi]QHF97501.1 hypothetical protein DEH18_30785 [Streptomyces sp. NHF165]GEB48774.1 hypothetical protein SCA03_13250 [Streptomyces cacaoi]
MSHPLSRIRPALTRSARAAKRRPASLDGPAGRVYDDLADGLPEEDLAEDLTESLELYVMGSKPRCEESEYLELVEDAIERMARGA